ncbi:hypothetical protein [Novosphingobium sp.]|uniref:hypothetical protein n=1 Tax=Novosphingobium sp. TaxID=1874826 RepID=UPI0026373A78|nr:hypothetical protein [Novosphingobium sp.]
MVTATSTRQMPVADQLRRAAELDALRLQRALTASEQAEADNLADRAYHRAWRAMQRDHGAQLAARLVAQAPRTLGPWNTGNAA